MHSGIELFEAFAHGHFHNQKRVISMSSFQARNGLCDKCSNGSKNQIFNSTLFCHDLWIQFLQYKDPLTQQLQLPEKPGPQNTWFKKRSAVMPNHIPMESNIP